MVKTQDHPLAESLVITEDENLEFNQTDCLFSDSKVTEIDWKEEQSKDPNISRVSYIVGKNIKLTKAELKAEPAEVQKYLRHRSALNIKDGKIYRKYRSSDQEEIFQLILPEKYREWALKALHDNVGHQGRDRTLWLVKQRFFWPGVDEAVKTKVQTCPNWLRRKSPTKATAVLVPITSTRPMELVCIDYLSLEKSKGGYENILVVTDHFTKYAQAFPTSNQTAQTTARILFENFFTHYSFPSRLHSD